MNIIIGTANFAQEYAGRKVHKNEQDKIWKFARSAGIDTVDTATAYGKVFIPSDFKVIDKIRTGEEPKDGYACLIHHADNVAELMPDLRQAKKSGQIQKIGVSIYHGDPIPKGMDIVQLPYSIGNRTCEEYFTGLKGVEIHARSIFGRGELIEEFGIQDCIKFVLNNPNIHSIVVGIDTCEQLREVVSITRKEQK